MDVERRAELEWLGVLVRTARKHDFTLMRACRARMPGDFVVTQKIPRAA